MCQQCVDLRIGFVFLALSLVGLGPGSATAQKLLTVYGSEGPSFAIREAAAAFENKNQVQVEVVSGPPNEWLDKAKDRADLVYASAEFMMSDFVSRKDLAVDEASITPLYLRPSTVLVRPGNPKGIRDFPDLLKPGIQVMVVTGSGQTGLWEDMAGKKGDSRIVQAFRKNVAVFAANSTEATRVWDDNKAIDAWVTWDIWYRPLHQKAARVRVSQDYLIYRQCSIALTKRGLANSLAAKFIDFLTSPEGEAIFESWEWQVSPPPAPALTAGPGISAVCSIKNSAATPESHPALDCIQTLLETYRSQGISPAEMHISVVFHGAAAFWLLNDRAYARHVQRNEPNPHKKIIEQFLQSGLSIELCGKTLTEQGWRQTDLLPKVTVVPGAYQRLIDLQLRGYAYIEL